MNHKTNPFVTCLLLIFILSGVSCKKDGNTADTKTLGKGNLYFTWADEGTLKVDLETGAKSLVLPDDTKQNGFDVSKDQKTILIMEDVAGKYDTQRFKILNLSDGSIVRSVEITRPGDTFTNPRLSPDGSLILCSSLLPGPVLIIDIAGDKVFTLNDIQGKKFTDACWMPDVTVLLSTADGLYKSNGTFNQVSLVKTMNYDKWGSVSVRPDGKKIAFTGGNHIWMMDANGDNLVQVTESGSQEGAICFSPDGNSLLVGVHHFSGGAGPWGNYYHMVIIPADGKKYNIDNTGSGVKPVIPKGDSSPQAYNKKIQWL